MTSAGRLRSEGDGILKQCVAVSETGGWRLVATTLPRGLSSQGIAVETVEQIIRRYTINYSAKAEPPSIESKIQTSKVWIFDFSCATFF